MKFEKDKKYIFCKSKLFIDGFPIMGVEKYEGKPIMVFNSNFGYCDDFMVSPDWCEEVTDEPKVITKFEEGKRYRFNIDKYAQWYNTSFDRLFEDGWTTKCINKEVSIDVYSVGHIGNSDIAPSWCDEIKEI